MIKMQIWSYTIEQIKIQQQPISYLPKQNQYPQSNYQNSLPKKKCKKTDPIKKKNGSRTEPNLGKENAEGDGRQRTTENAQRQGERKRERELERERTLQKRPNENGKLEFNIKRTWCNVNRWILILNLWFKNAFHGVWALFR